MEFTELSELNDMITYSRSYRGNSLTFQKKQKSKSNGAEGKRNYFELNFAALEEVIEGSLSSGKGSLRSPKEMSKAFDPLKFIDSYCRKEKQETLDDIISDIQKTLRFQETVRQDKKVLKLKDEVQSIILNPNKVNDNKNKKRIARSSSFSFETEDYTDDYFNSPKKQPRAREDGDVTMKQGMLKMKVVETDFSECLNIFRKLSRENSLKMEGNSDKKSFQELPKVPQESIKSEVSKVSSDSQKWQPEVSKPCQDLRISLINQPLSPRFQSTKSPKLASFQQNGGSQNELNIKKRKILESGKDIIEERVGLEEEHYPSRKNTNVEEGSKKNSAGKMESGQKSKFSVASNEDKIARNIVEELKLSEPKIKKVESCNLVIEKRKAENENQDPNTNDNVLKIFSALPRRTSNRIQRHSSILILGAESSKKKFDKMPTDKIEESFSEKIIKKSSLSVNLLQMDNPPRLNAPNPSNFNRKSRGQSSSKRKQIKIFYFSTPANLKIFIGLDDTVQEVIAAAMSAYICADSVNKALLKYPNHPEAYELRFLDDDDDFKPETSFDALERDRKFTTYNTDALAFCEIPNFKPISKSALMRDPNSDYGNIAESELIKRKEKEIEKIMNKKNNIVIDVSIVEENYSTLLALDPEKSVGDIFIHIQRRIKINQKKYIVLAMPPEDKNDRKDGEVQWEPEEVDVNMPLKNLKTNKLQLIRKVYADEPKERVSEYRNKDDSTFSNNTKENVEDDQEFVDPQSILLTEVQASKYEEFEVIKINSRGRRQPRLLGIDQFRIHNKVKERNQGGITNLFTLFTGSTTKNPERLIDKIKEVKMISNRIFYIEVAEENTRTKILTFEAKNNQMASYILAKLNFLMKINKGRKKK